MKRNNQKMKLLISVSPILLLSAGYVTFRLMTGDWDADPVNTTLFILTGPLLGFAVYVAYRVLSVTWPDLKKTWKETQLINDNYSCRRIAS